MRFNYSHDLFPPGLILPAFVRGLGSTPFVERQAKLDTGADLTVIPEAVRETLNLKPCGQKLCLGALDEQAQSVPTYFIELSLDRGEFLQLEVLARPRDVVLLGRDVLNDFVLLANGPDEFFEIEMPNSNGA